MHKNNVSLPIKISNNKIGTIGKVNRSGENSSMIHVGEIEQELRTRIEEYKIPLKIKDNKSIYGKHSNDMNYLNENSIQRTRLIKIETNNVKRKTNRT